MVSFPPLMPSVGWFADFLQSKAKDFREEQSILAANDGLPSSRDFGRFVLKETNGEAITLSLAVEGGGRQLRTLNKIDYLLLSDHGDWRRNHLRAMEACLGKKPFFPYIFPRLTSAYLDKNLKSLREFNTAIFQILYSFILGETEDFNLSLFYNNKILQERGKEIALQFDNRISSLEAICSFGKESLLGFLAINL